MWHLLTPSRKRVEAGRTLAHRPRWYRPRCEPLEDRCVPSVSVSPGGPASGLVGSPVTWTATASGDGTTPVYQFSVGPAGGTAHVVRDFSTSNTFAWNPMQEGTYDIQVAVEDSYGASPSDFASASYTATSRATGTSAVISPMSNPLVVLYSAPPSTDPDASSMYVQYSLDQTSWLSTTPQPIVPGESTNFIVAGLLPQTTYYMRHVLSDATTSAPLTFTTGSLPTTLTFPSVSVPQPPGPATDTTDNMLLHMELGSATPNGHVTLLATDLAGNIDWYYDPVANNLDGYGTELVPGGTVLMLGGNQLGQGGESVLREMDLAGDPLRETNVGAINAQLAALGKDPIFSLNHEALRLPNGDAAVLAGTRRTITVNGAPTLYTADGVIVLDQNFQVVWAWDSLDWLDPARLPTDGEGPSDFTHANAISWSPGDGDLLVSLRSQDWVVKVAYAGGTGDGHIVWRLGAGGNFTLNSTDPTAWFSHQHDAVYINDNTIVLFDDGNTRRMTNPNADSRGQEWVLNEQAMTATPAVDADLGNYSGALGAAQVLSNGNLDFTSGLVGESIEVSPDGTINYVMQVSGPEYRSYFMSTLYSGNNFTQGLLDPGFERPSQGSGPSAYQYDPPGSPWRFSGTAGLAGNGSAITSGNPSAPQGSQVAFLQGTGMISQAADSLAAGYYQISFFAAQGGSNGTNNEEIAVEVDGTVVATFTPTGTGYATYTAPVFSLTAGSHTITFVGVGPAGAGDTALLDQVGLLLQPSGSASFVALDTATQGNWTTAYGADGYAVMGGTTSYPGYATVTPSGNSSYTWSSSTTDVRAPWASAAAASRVAACWYSCNSFTVNVDITDGQTHQVGLYLLDWDNSLGGRSEQVQVLDAVSGKVLDTESASAFQGGDYLVWTIGGDVTFKVISTGSAGNNAVISGLFFG